MGGACSTHWRNEKYIYYFRWKTLRLRCGWEDSIKIDDLEGRDFEGET
jgi:hypothetical protein